MEPVPVKRQRSAYYKWLMYALIISGAAGLLISMAHGDSLSIVFKALLIVCGILGLIGIRKNRGK